MKLGSVIAKTQKRQLLQMALDMEAKRLTPLLQKRRSSTNKGRH